ncbi:MAG: hypothetical protein NVSMB64_15260 [Candidatus Velthaea sp.]
MNLRAIWSFIAGDSRRGPALVAVAIGVVILLVRFGPASTAFTGFIFFALIAAALIAAVFERV